MIDPQHTTQHLGAPEIIHREITTALVLVLEKRKPFALARFLVPDQGQVCRVAELREYDRYIAFCQLVVEPADVDVCGVAVVDMPGGAGGGRVFEFPFVERLGCADGVHLFWGLGSGGRMSRREGEVEDYVVVEKPVNGMGVVTA